MKPQIYHHAVLSVAAASVALLGCTASFGRTTIAQSPGQRAHGVHTLGNNGAASNGTGSGANPAPAATGGIGAANSNNGADLNANANGNGTGASATGAGAGAGTNGAHTLGNNGAANNGTGSGSNPAPANTGGIGANNDNNGADIHANSNGVRSVRGDHGRTRVTSQREIHRVQKLLGHFVNETVETNSLRDSSKYLTKADRRNLRTQLKNVNAKALNGRIREFRKDWKAKYGKEFKITKPETVFSNIEVAQRKVTSGSLLVTLPSPSAMGSNMHGMSNLRHGQAHASLNANANNGISASTAVSPGNGGVKQGVTSGTNGGTTSRHSMHMNRTMRRKMRMARKAAMHRMGRMAGMSGRNLRLHVIREHKRTYRLQLPTSLTATRYRKAVQYVLTKVDQNRNQWPGNATSAYRLVSYKLLKTLFKPSANQVSDAQLHH